MALTLDDIRSSPARKRFAQMYSSPSAGGGDKESLGYLTPEQKQDMLAALARTTLNTADTISTAIDTPAAIFRGMLAGKPTSGFSFDSGTRVSGQELLEKYGILNKDANPYFKYGAGLAAEILLDPLLPLNAPLRALGIGGKAAKAVGIIGDAPLAALAKLGGGDLAKGAELARKTWTGRRAYQFLGDLVPATQRGLKQTTVPKAMLTADNLALRPPIGQRAAQSQVNLEELVKASRDPQALEKVKTWLGVRGINYDSVKGKTLGGALSFDYPGLNSLNPAVWNPKAAAPFLDALDAVGQAARWSPLARGLSALTDGRVGGEYKASEQFFQMRKSDRTAKAEAAARALAGEQTLMVSSLPLPAPAKKLLGAETLLSEPGMRLLTRFHEGTQTVSDMRLRSAIGALEFDKIVSNWDSIRKGFASEAKALGFKGSKMEDEYGVLWSPRRAVEADFGEYGSGASRANYTTQTLENETRKKELRTPGGTIELGDVSLLPEVKELVYNPNTTSKSISDAADAIKRFIDNTHGPRAADPRVRKFKTYVPAIDPTTGQPLRRPLIDPITGQTAIGPDGNPLTEIVTDPNQVITKKQAEAIARFEARKNPALDESVRMFGDSPLSRQAAALRSQARAQTNAREVYTSMAEAAMHAGAGRRANSIAGSGMKPMDRAMYEIAQALGMNTNEARRRASKTVRENLQREIAKLNGIADPSTVKLSEYALPESVYNRLTRTSDFYNSPRAQQELLGLFDQITNIFKGFALAFPATKIRDIYSNTFLVWLESGNVFDVRYGFSLAKDIVAGDFNKAADALREIPGYTGSIQQLRQKLTNDVSRTGILQSLSTNDLVSSNRTGALNQFVPGSEPMKRGDWFFKELMPDGSRNLTQMLDDQVRIRGVRLPGQKYGAQETRNAVLRASENASNYSDTVARLGGMLALMKRGVPAEEAAKRITAALVDYGSLTPFERNIARRLLPWYAYNSRSAKYIAGQLFNSPGGGYGMALRAARLAGESDEDTYIPEAMRQQLAIRMPDWMKPYLGVDPNAPTTTFFKDFDIPGIDTLNLIGRAPTYYGSIQSTASNVMQQAHPIIRSMYELATDEDSFSRRPLTQAVTPLDRIYKKAFNSQTSMNPLIRMAINMTPGPHQRLIGPIGGLMDDRIPMRQRVAKQLFNSLAGIKLQDVDPEWQLQDARRQLAGRLSGYMTDYTESYIPKEVLPQVPAELMPSYMLDRTLAKELRERRKAKAK